MEKAQVLIVEDDAIIAMDIESQLKKLGYGVTGVVAYGEKVIEKIKENETDVVLMDIVLKGEMDGIEAADQIRTQFDIPVIFLTAFANKDRLERAKLTYPFGFILKPFQNKDLEVTIEMALYMAKIDAERKQTEISLQESEELHRITLGNISDAVFLTDDTGLFTFICPNVGVIFGYSEEEVRTLDNISKLLGDNYYDTNELEALGEIINLEIEIIDKAGKKHDLLVNVKGVSIKGGTKLITCRDITERKQTEKALQRAHNDLERRVEERTAELSIANQELCGEINERQRVEEVLRESTHELNIRNRIAEIFIKVPDDKMYFEVLQVVLDALESPYGTFAYINEHGDRIVPVLTRDIWVDCEVQDIDMVFPREKWKGIWGKCLIDKETVSSSGLFRVPEGHVPITKSMAVPIIHQGEAIGNFMVANKTTDYSDEDKE
ncbi:MAG: response regulator, partial [Thermodesulfobacteriota bacterium]